MQKLTYIPDVTLTEPFEESTDTSRAPFLAERSLFCFGDPSTALGISPPRPSLVIPRADFVDPRNLLVACFPSGGAMLSPTTGISEGTSHSVLDKAFGHSDTYTHIDTQAGAGGAMMIQEIVKSMIQEQEIVKFLQQHPKHAEILRRAIEVEEKNANEPNWLGWEWYEVRAYPAQLVKLVIEGLIKVNFKSNTSTCYLLVDREMMKRSLKATS